MKLVFRGVVVGKGGGLLPGFFFFRYEFQACFSRDVVLGLGMRIYNSMLYHRFYKL